MVNALHKALFAVPLSVALAASVALPLPGSLRQAHADELSDAQATLAAASSELDSLNKEYNALQQQLSSLDSQISETTEKVIAAQQQMLKGRDNLSDAILSQYKSDGSLSLVGIVLSSTSIADFTKNLTYYTAIQEDEAERVAEQKQLRDEFSSSLEELDSQRDAQQKLLNEADQKKAQAQKVVSDASAKVSSIQEAQAQAALAALQAQAEQMKAAEEQKQAEAQSQAQESANWNTNTDRTPSANTNSDSGSNSNSNSNSSSDTSDSSTGWKTGVASAYGGSSDASTPNPGTTATGAVCNDSSMGVAIPMSWSNYRSYFGHAVEIKYGGKTVVATINDCGGLAGGARSLDLQPGVFKAFGFSTCQDWGLRTVSYRIL